MYIIFRIEIQAIVQFYQREQILFKCNVLEYRSCVILPAPPPPPHPHPPPPPPPPPPHPPHPPKKIK